MLTMYFIVWMLPVILMLHDFEEIIMAEGWAKKYGEVTNIPFTKDKPFALTYINRCYTPTFASGVCMVFTSFTIVSLFSVIFNSYLIWFAFFIGLAFHFVVHVAMCLRFHHYVPGVVTAVPFLIPNILFLNEAEKILRYGTLTILVTCAVVLVLLFIILPAMHKLIGHISKYICRYTENTVNK